MKLEPGMAYNTKTLNKVFALLSVIFLMVTIWMMFDDYIRPWKGFQIKGLKIKGEVLRAKIDEFDKNLDADKLAEINKDLEAAKKDIEAKASEIASVEEKLGAVKAKIQAEKLINGEFNAFASEYQFRYEIAHAHGDPGDKKLKKKLDEFKANFAASKERLKQFQSDESKFKKEIAELKGKLITAEKRSKNLLGARDRLELALAKTNVKNPIWVMRNMPFIDYLDPTLKIQQVVLKNITDDRYFQHVPKVDRCTTCHMFIDQPGYEKQENPYKTHPRLDLVLNPKSPHPMDKIGCTVCHGGEGHRVNDFQAVAHTPQNADQKKVWEDKYHWHEPHKIAQPMVRLQYAEAACIKCHVGVDRVPKATVLNEGRKLLEVNGCYGCHVIKGFDHLVKPAPSLKKIGSKVTKEFFKNWVWDPYSFNKHSKMPAFFGQINNSSPEFMQKNIAEVNAMAEYLFKLSKPYKPFAKYTGGNAERGKKLIDSVGCLGCHGVEGIENSKRVGGARGPYLTATGSKVSGDWLVSWLKRPSHFQPDTIMPSFRLTNREANDIAAYLLSLRNKKFEELKFEPMDNKVRDDLLMMYFTQFDTEAVAKAKLAKMDDHARTQELGERSVGKYGCFSCHSVSGMENRSPIGPDLSTIGSKPLAQMGFGHEKIDHKRDSWLYHHLENPRRWDRGVVKSFNDLNRMPNFYFKKEEIEPMVTYLLGLSADTVPLRGQKRLNAEEALAERGRKVVNKYNCKGCHQIDGVGGDLLKVYEEDDINEGPPRLVKQGSRVQSDWFHYFLKNVHVIRPWLKVRMPSFELTNDERNAIVAYFQADSKEVSFEETPAKVAWEPGEKRAALRLFKELDCVSCHTGGFNREEALAPDLHYAKRRLRADWIDEWLTDPQKILPGTSMPNFWEGGESQAPNVLGGNVKKQIKALRKYLLELGYNEYHKPFANN